VSNTVASALWLIDYLLLAAQRGVGGVNVHGGLAACRGYTPLCVPRAHGLIAGSAPGIDPVADLSLGAAPAGSGELAPQPDFYGLLFVHQLEGGHWLTIRSDRPTQLREFALQMPDGSIRLALDNPDPRLATTVELRVAGGGGTGANVLRLTGPSLDATSHVQFGRSQVAQDGTWRPGGAEGVSATAAGTRLVVGAASAVLVTLLPTDRAGHR